MGAHSAGGLGALLVLGIATGYTVLATSSARGWSRWRTASFLTGSALLVLVIVPGHTDSFTRHVLQHLVAGMIAPVALVLGAPLTLLLRTLPTPTARRLIRLLRSGPLRVLAHPVPALVLALGPLPLLYLTPAYGWFMDRPALHMLLLGHFVLAGFLFVWTVAGPDPAPHRPSVPARLVVLGVAVTVHAVVSQLIYAGVGDLPVGVADRRAGATLMYYGGDIADLILAAALVTGWRRPRRTAGGTGGSPTPARDHASPAPWGGRPGRSEGLPRVTGPSHRRV